MVKLITDDEGPGSVIEIERYIATVIRERTIMRPDTTAYPASTPERLARNIRMSVLHRLGYVNWQGWSPSYDEGVRVEEAVVKEEKP